MKWLLLSLIFSLSTAPHTRAEEPARKFKLCELERRSGVTEEWWFSDDRIKSVPRWAPLEQKPPLSVNKALKIGTGWLLKREGVPQQKLGAGTIDSISLLSCHTYYGPLKNFYYYKIVFIVGEFDAEICIVLMDGTVLEPVEIPSKSPKSMQKSGSN